MNELKLIDVNGEVGIIFPEALCQRLQVSLGDELHVEPAPNGMLIYANASETKLLFLKAYRLTWITTAFGLKKIHGLPRPSASQCRHCEERRDAAVHAGMRALPPKNEPMDCHGLRPRNDAFQNKK